MESVNIRKFYLYQITVIFSMFFSLLGFSYNVWRMEVTEENSNIRMACFEILLELSSLEQLVYAAHYDGDIIEGNPRKGWVKVGLVADLSVLTTKSVESQSASLKSVWSETWHKMSDSRESVDQLVSSIDSTRFEIKQVLSSLE